MRRSARVVLGTLGIAAAVYGLASLTGGWLGTPLWWERGQPLTHEPPLAGAPSEVVVRVPRDGREWISGALIVVGSAVLAALPRRSRVLRFVVGILGVAALVYGVASVTGRWLGTPPWWWRLETRQPVVRLDGLIEWVRPYSEWNTEPAIGWTVEAIGLVLVAFALWPRKPRPVGPARLAGAEGAAPPSQPSPWPGGPR